MVAPHFKLDGSNGTDNDLLSQDYDLDISSCVDKQSLDNMLIQAPLDPLTSPFKQDAPGVSDTNHNPLCKDVSSSVQEVSDKNVSPDNHLKCVQSVEPLDIISMSASAAESECHITKKESQMPRPLINASINHDTNQDGIFPPHVSSTASSLPNARQPWPAPEGNHALSLPTMTVEFPRNLSSIYKTVAATGTYNYLKARIPVNPTLNIQAWRDYAHRTELPDTTLCDMLDFGFPSNYKLPHPPCPTFKNHSSALKYSSHVRDYIKTEVELGAMAGPFPNLPFAPWCQVNPLMTRDKKRLGAITGKRRTVVDLSYPEAASVNHGISKDSYLGYSYKLRLPQSRTLMSLILKQGCGALLISKDISRAYRNLSVCPSDYALYTIMWDSKFYCDLSLAFGSRFAAMACQRASEAVCHFLSKEPDPVDAASYIDDIAAVAPPDYQVATRVDHRISSLLKELNFPEATEKATPPATQMIWCGLLYDSVKFTVSIPDYKLKEVSNLVDKWAGKFVATRNELQQLLGKLIHVAQCSPAASLYIQSLLCELRNSPCSGNKLLSHDAKLDLLWFKNNLKDFNGVHYFNTAPLPAEKRVNLAYIQGYVAASTKHEYFKQQAPVSFDQLCSELASVLIAVKLWGHQWSGHTVTVFLSQGASDVINTGKASNTRVNGITRLIWAQAFVKDFQLSAHPHIIPPVVKVTGKKCVISREMWRECVKSFT